MYPAGRLRAACFPEREQRPVGKEYAERSAGMGYFLTGSPLVGVATKP